MHRANRKEDQARRGAQLADRHVSVMDPEKGRRFCFEDSSSWHATGSAVIARIGDENRFARTVCPRAAGSLNGISTGISTDSNRIISGF